MFAAVLGFLWWLADRHLKEKFTGYLKYGSMVLIGLFICTEAYMVMEKGNLIAAHECCADDCGDNATQEPGSLQCEQCCISYTSPSYCELVNMSVYPVQIAGDEGSLTFRDNDLLIIPLDVEGQGVAYDVYLNFSCEHGYSMYMFKGKSDVDDNTVGIWNGSDYDTFYAYGSSADFYTQEIDMSGMQYWFDNTTLTGIRMTSTDYPTTDQYAYFDQSWLVGSMTNKMYCTDTIDTGTIMAWHYTEYWVMHDWIGAIPWVMMFCTVAIIIQALRMWYDGTYGK